MLLATGFMTTLYNVKKGQEKKIKSFTYLLGPQVYFLFLRKKTFEFGTSFMMENKCIIKQFTCNYNLISCSKKIPFKEEML